MEELYAGVFDDDETRSTWRLIWRSPADLREVLDCQAVTDEGGHLVRKAGDTWLPAETNQNVAANTSSTNSNNSATPSNSHQRPDHPQPREPSTTYRGAPQIDRQPKQLRDTRIHPKFHSLCPPGRAMPFFNVGVMRTLRIPTVRLTMSW